MRTQLIVRVTWTSLALIVGCAPALEPDSSDGMGDAAISMPDAGLVETSGAFMHTLHGGRSVTTVVDATDDANWQYLDLDTHSADDAAERWDLGFSRFRIRSNGGASGAGGVAIAALPDADWAGLERAPDQGFREDQPDGETDADSEPDNAFNGGDEDWYVYNVMTHTLSPLPIVYVVRSTDARFYKLEIEDYYDDAGTPGVMTFVWAEIDPPAMADTE